MATINSIGNLTGPLTITDSADTSKEVLFVVSPVTTSTTRTWTVDDRNIDFDAVPTSIVTDSGTCIPAAGSFSIVGSGTVNTSATGGVLTVTGSSSGIGSWVVLTGGESQPYSISNNIGYVSTSGSTFTGVLPTTASVGDVIYISETTINRAFQLNQNAGQQILGLTTSSTAGTSGYLLTSISGRNAIKLVCIVADTTWFVVGDNGGSYTLN